MSDTVLSPGAASSPDGDVPRLAEPTLPNPSTTTPPPAPVDPAPVPTLTAAPSVGEAPTLPSTAPVLPHAAPTPPTPAPAPPVKMPDAPQVLTSAELPSLPTPVAPTVTPVATPEDDDDGEPRHPMAHLMPTKSKPTEASIRAAEARAAHKAKGKKIKLGIAAGALVVAAAAGPPVYIWTANAINEAGNTSTDDVGD